jgi:hypothetical protein
MKRLPLALPFVVSLFGSALAQEWTPIAQKDADGGSLFVDLRGKSRKPARAPEPFEGVWAQTKKECLDTEGPNSRTIIDLGNTIEGKPAPIMDQYENHCLIEQRVGNGASITLGATCYEFWEDLTAKRDARKATIKLSSPQKDRLRIEDKMCLRCKQ